MGIRRSAAAALVSGLGLAAIIAAGRLTAVGPGGGGQSDPPARADTPTRKRADEFIAAFNRGDAEALAGFWTPDADYIDQTGRHVRGRDEIRKLYERVFAERKGAKLTITPTADKLLSADVAIEDGFTEVTPADGGPPTAARYTAVLVRKDGQWYLASVHDAIAHPPSNAEHFDDLVWLIGEWTGEAEKGESARATYEWAENQNFIVSSFATTLNGVPVAGGTQWIGWDPTAKQVRSWSFYSGGGFGEAVWTRDGGRWLLKTTATTADGKKIAVTNVVTKVDADHATWHPTNMVVDGRPVPDAPPVRLKRVKSDRP